MNSNFYKALDLIRKKSTNTVEQGFAFEKLSKVYFENDDIQKQEYEKVWHYKDWAKENPTFSKTDIGIDLVGKLRDGGGLAAIQCKFLNSNYQISKEDLDSFVSAASNEIFKRLVLIDTSNEDLGSNAKSMIDNLNKTYQRIQKYDLENSRIDWLEYIENEKISLSKKRDPFDHQLKAIAKAKKYYSSNDRGKMIMACGTGKTYTSLKIAEEIAHKKFVLCMVPSLALMSQSIREWKNDSAEDFVAFSACSDKKVGKLKNDSDLIQIKLNELAIPATTNSKKLAEEINKVEKGKMTVVFSTYHSIEVISDAQKKYSMKPFDLIICDEAHRTTGATFEGEQDSYFIRIHDDKYVEGVKRLYMTATPRIFGNKAKQKADVGRVELASMDDPKKFGKEFFNRGFNWAVENNLLSDYKVVILAVDENLVGANLQKSLEEGSELKLTDATKIIGVYKALAKVGFDKKENEKLKPIKKAIAFSQSIEISKIFEKEFSNVINEYIKNEKIKDENKVDLDVEVKHVDGTFNADQRNDNLNWLKSDTDKRTCRILSNVKCLSEGVDVPSLDAIMFLHPKKSQIDVVQAVGRVMRKAEGKDLGYVIIPVTVAPGVAPEKALNDNEKYKVVWQIVNALRTHDERLDSKVNMLSLGEDVSDKIEIVTMSAEQDATTAKVEDVAKKKPKKTKEEEVINISQTNQEEVDDKPTKEEQMSFELDDLSQAIKAKIVQKCGTRDYWENWATDISKIAKEHISNINSILIKKKSNERKKFDKFLDELRDDLNPEITESDAVEMLAQHIITKPVFETLFVGNNFTKDNPISKAMEDILKSIYDFNKIKKKDTLQNFYQSIKRRSEGLISSKGKNTLINELYERFFKNAFPLTVQKLGIVYTPIEAVDFIIHSINWLLKKEFNKSLESEKVHILDPFAGTGTFVCRLLQNGSISKNRLKNKYLNEIHTNEIILLAYYIAGINIETVYQEIMKENQYLEFKGNILTDTFQLYEQERDMIANLLPDNSERRTKQKKRDITVIMGNPPYSAKQIKADLKIDRMNYPNLDEAIEKNYALESSVSLKNALYDSYVRSFRWSTERLNKNDGIIGFITNSSWITKQFADGMRKSLSKDFNQIYVVNLRGDVRSDILSNGGLGEGENIFGQGSMTGISICFLIKKKNSKNLIKYYEVKNNLKKKQKLQLLEKFGSLENLDKENLLKEIIPNQDNEWINQGNNSFKKYMLLGSKKDLKETLFLKYSNGVKTQRDVWCYNFSKSKLIKNIKKTIEFYNFNLKKLSGKNITEIKKKVEVNPKEISWSEHLYKNISLNKKAKFSEKHIVKCLYRPFTFTNLYYSKNFNDRQGLTKSFFKENNEFIMVSGLGSQRGFSVFSGKNLPDIQLIQNGQCFVKSSVEENENVEGLFKDFPQDNRLTLISTYVVDYFGKFYNKKISNTEIFKYIYGILHSPDYFNLFKNNLSRSLPRIPRVKKYEDFKKFSKLGTSLMSLHINFEEVPKYDLDIQIKNNKIEKKKLYQISKMKFFKDKNNRVDLTKIEYNNNISLNGIPKESFNYKVNAKSPLEWVMERQSIKVDKDSLITNNPNDYANETMKNPAYPLELLQKVITVSLETQKLIKNLPKLDID